MSSWKLDVNAAFPSPEYHLFKLLTATLPHLFFFFFFLQSKIFLLQQFTGVNKHKYLTQDYWLLNITVRYEFLFRSDTDDTEEMGVLIRDKRERS